MRTSGEKNSPPGWSKLHRAGSGGGEKGIKGGSQGGWRTFLWGQPALTPLGEGVLSLFVK